jgi:hypothetical protein
LIFEHGLIFEHRDLRLIAFYLSELSLGQGR